MGEQRIFTVDAFASEPFRGNPAAVCPLEGPRDAAWMQSIAAEMNLSETAFLHPEGDGWRLRWFTPAVEVKLCGHATLASAHVLWETGALAPGAGAVFATKSGRLEARQEGDRIAMDFPAYRGKADPPPADLLRALGVSPIGSRRFGAEALGQPAWLFELESASDVRGCRPGFAALRGPSAPFVMVTARDEGGAHDVVSRFFAGCAGIDEDPVTGSMHSCLAPYWAERLGRERLTGYQASARGGEVGMLLSGDRVTLSGRAVTVLRGRLAV